MFKCDMCGLPSNKKETQTKEIALTRKKTYYTLCLKKVVRKTSYRHKEEKYKFMYLHKRDFELTKKLTSKEGGWNIVSERNSIGTEIVRENKLCHSCATVVEQ